MQSRNYEFNTLLKKCQESGDYNKIYQVLGEINRIFHLNEKCYRKRYFGRFIDEASRINASTPHQERVAVERMLCLIGYKYLRRKMSFRTQGHYPQYLKEFASEYERYKNGGYMGVFDSYYGLTYSEYQELILDAVRSNPNEPDLDKLMTFEHGLVCKILEDEEKRQFEFPRGTCRF